MHLWTWRNNFILYDENIWRTAAFKYEPWRFPLWFLFPLSCQGNCSQSFILHLLVMAKGLNLSWTPVCCRYKEERGRTGSVCLVHLMLNAFHLYTGTHHSLGVVAREPGRAAIRKNVRPMATGVYCFLAISLFCEEIQVHLQEYTYLWIWVVYWDTIPQGSFPCKCDCFSSMQEGILVFYLSACSITIPWTNAPTLLVTCKSVYRLRTPVRSAHVQNVEGFSAHLS